MGFVLKECSSGLSAHFARRVILMLFFVRSENNFNWTNLPVGPGSVPQRLPPLFRNGPMINIPPVAVEAKVRGEDVNRAGPAADFHRLKALGIRQFNRTGHAAA